MPTWPSRRQPSVDNLRTEVAENVVSAGPIMRLQSIFPTLSPPPVHARHQRSKSHNSVISVDEAAPATAKGHSAKGKSLGSSADKAKSEPVELKVGKCITCNSSVRWPVNLIVFRCTICLTINDVAPRQNTATNSDEIGVAVTCDSPNEQPSPLLTIERTRAILQDCVSTFQHHWEICHSPPSHPPPPPPGTAIYEKIGIQPQPASDGFQGLPLDWLNDATQMPVPDLIDFAFPNRDESSEPRDSRAELEYNQIRTPSPTFPDNNYFPPPSRPAPVPPPPSPGIQKHSERKGSHPSSTGRPLNDSQTSRRATQRELASKIFKPLEDYIAHSFSQWLYINDSFQRVRPAEVVVPDFLESASKTRVKHAREKALREQKKKMKLDARTPSIDNAALGEFYKLIMSADKMIIPQIKAIVNQGKAEGDTLTKSQHPSGSRYAQRNLIAEIEGDVIMAREHLEIVLLRCCEALLKRPRQLFKRPEHCRALLIMLANPILASKRRSYDRQNWTAERSSSKHNTGQYTGILKRIFGLMSNLSNDAHHYIVTWFSWQSDSNFRTLVEVTGSFVTYRLNRHYGKINPRAGRQVGVIYENDWQLRAAAKVYSLLFAANNMNAANRGSNRLLKMPAQTESSEGASPNLVARRNAATIGYIIPISDFYNSMLDYADLVKDFDQWEKRTAKFCFCQYPFLLSMGSKIHVLEYDARRQMEVQARSAFFDSIGLGRDINRFLSLKVRRECLVEDSLKGISEGVGTGSDEIKKGLRIEFSGEDGIDAGGLKKEWFLLLAREVFDPNYGLFVYDDESRYCYFNPNSFEASEQFFLVGVLLGLAIYNSTILDIALPLVVFKKLLSSRPVNPAVKTPLPTTKPAPTPLTLDDLAVFRPSLAHGLRQLLEYDGNVETDICRDFVVEIERYGETVQIPLVENGQNRPVTNANRKEFVDLYINYILDVSVAKQFEPFKRGFYTVCGGNALVLFRPEEIELLIRGSDEPLDIDALKAVAIYDGWGDVPDQVSTIRWFWAFFKNISPQQQRMLLTFVTGSDRIPAVGIANLVIKLTCGGDDCNRYPIARTCFNALVLYNYRTREKLEKMLWRAVVDSEGFGLK